MYVGKNTSYQIDSSKYDPSKDVTYTVKYVYNDVIGENEDYDPETFYLGFASIDTQAKKIISTDEYGNQTIGTYVKIYNSDAGFVNNLVTTRDTGWSIPFLISPETIPTVSSKEKPYLKPIEMNKYNPDTISVISLDTTYNRDTPPAQYVKILSDEYLKAPWDHSLLKSEIHYRDDTEGKPDKQ